MDSWLWHFPGGFRALAIGLVAALFALLATPPARATTTVPQLREVKLVEPGRLESFTTTFHVTAAPEVKTLTLALSDWQGPQGTPLRGYPLATATQSTVQPGLWQVLVTLPNVTAVGAYKGRLSIASPGAATPPAPDNVDIVFAGSFRPSVSLSQTSTISLKVSSCDGWCGVTKLFLPDEAGAFGLEVKNNSPAAVDVTISHVPLGAMPATPSVVLASAGSNPASTLTIPNLAPGAAAKFLASVQNAPALDPAAYSGHLRVATRPAGSGDGADPVPVKQGDAYVLGNAAVSEIPVSVHVRVPVICALIVCILGVVVGRFASTLATPGFDVKLRYFPEYRSLYESVGELEGRLVQLSVAPSIAADLAAAMKQRVDALWRKMLDGTEAAPAAAFEALRTHQRLVLKWGNLHHLAAGIPNLPQPSRDKIENLRRRLLAPLAKPDELEKDLDDLRADLRAVIASQRTEGGSVDSPAGPTAAPDAGDDPGALKGARAWAVWLFNLLSGVGTAGIRFYHDFARPVVHFVLLGAIVLYGVWVNYSTGTASSTFGSTRLGDYAALFVWGITADLISKGFQGLTLFRRT